MPGTGPSGAPAEGTRGYTRAMARARLATPISLTSVLVPMTLALTVGWEVLVLREFQALTDGFRTGDDADE